MFITDHHTRVTGFQTTTLALGKHYVTTHAWFVEMDYRLGSTLFGGSYGEHELDADNGGSIQEGDLTMLFAHYELTSPTTLIAEWNNESFENATGDTTLDADTIAVGINVQF